MVESASLFTSLGHFLLYNFFFFFQFISPHLFIRLTLTGWVLSLSIDCLPGLNCFSDFSSSDKSFQGFGKSFYEGVDFGASDRRLISAQRFSQNRSQVFRSCCSRYQVLYNRRDQPIFLISYTETRSKPTRTDVRARKVT